MTPSYGGGVGQSQPANRSQMLPTSEGMRLLARVDYRRVVFTFNALPAIGPVNHVVDDGGRIITHTRLTRAISTVVTSAGTRGMVVADEADELDSWSL
jgi:hypothetical protein